ncbi:MAG: serine/threonine-protein kinase, partial [Blastocatellia bacterium]
NMSVGGHSGGGLTDNGSARSRLTPGALLEAPKQLQISNSSRNTKAELTETESATLLQSDPVLDSEEPDTLIQPRYAPERSQADAEQPDTLIQSPEEVEGSESRTLLQPLAAETAAPTRRSDDSGSALNSATARVVTGSRERSLGKGALSQGSPTRPIAVRETADAGGLTRVGSVMGTPLYMSPEQCRGEVLDARADVYSLGVIAYRMLCGETPFTGNLDELLKSHDSVEPKSPKRRNSKVPRKVARIVLSALAKDPALRPQSADGFASALRAAAEGTGKLLRRAVSLYSEHFPAFLRLSLLAYTPLVVILGLGKLTDWLTPMEKAPYGLQLLVGIGGAVLAPMLGHLLAYFVISGVAVPIVIQLTLAPLRPPRIRTGFAKLRERWRPFLAASLIVMTLVFFGSLLIIPGIIIAVSFGLYAPVVLMEGLGVRATLKRAFKLSRRSWITVLVITVIQCALPILILSHFNNISLKISRTEAHFNISISDNLSSEASQLLNVLISPLTAIMTALLYLKTRHAGGETLKDAEQELDAGYQPRSRWEERMRTRTLSKGSRTSEEG